MLPSENNQLPLFALRLCGDSAEGHIASSDECHQLSALFIFLFPGVPIHYLIAVLLP